MHEKNMHLLIPGRPDAVFTHEGLEVGSGDADLLCGAADVSVIPVECCRDKFPFEVGNGLLAQLFFEVEEFFVGLRHRAFAEGDFGLHGFR